ncbi:hypothetical protein D3C72_2270020 [compost metagenome]
MATSQHQLHTQRVFAKAVKERQDVFAVFFAINVNTRPAFEEHNHDVAIEIMQRFLDTSTRLPFLKNFCRLHRSRNLDIFTRDLRALKKSP